MADRYLVGATWNTTASWSTSSGGASGASIPTSADNVFIDGSSPSFTVDVGVAYCLDFDCTGFSGTMNLNGNVLEVNGTTFFLSGAMGFTPNNGRVDFVASGGTVSIVTLGKSFYDIRFDGSLATFDQQDTITATNNFDLVAAAQYNTNGNAIDTKDMYWRTGLSSDIFFASSSIITITGTFDWQSPNVMNSASNYGTSEFRLTGDGGINAGINCFMRFWDMYVAADTKTTSVTGNINNWVRIMNRLTTGKGTLSIGTIIFNIQGDVRDTWYPDPDCTVQGTLNMRNLYDNTGIDLYPCNYEGNVHISDNKGSTDWDVTLQDDITIDGNLYIHSKQDAASWGKTRRVIFGSYDMTVGGEVGTDIGDGHGVTWVIGDRTFNIGGDLHLDDIRAADPKLAIIDGGTLRIGGDFERVPSLYSADPFDLSNHATIEVGGDWCSCFEQCVQTTTNEWTLKFLDGPGTITISLSTADSFNNITFGANKTHTFTAGQTLHMNGTLASTGNPGARSVLRSTTPGTWWYLTLNPLNGESTLENKVDVQDSNAGAGLEIQALQSLNSGNNINWNFSDAQMPVPVETPARVEPPPLYGFEQGYFWDILSSFWDSYYQRDQVAALWHGYAQIMDNEYHQIYQADFGKSLDTVPIYWRYQWPKMTFDNWEDNEVFHQHNWYEVVASGGEQTFPLISPHEVRFIRVTVNGVLQYETVDYEFQAGNQVYFVTPLDTDDVVMLYWVELDSPIDHYHREFTETLTSLTAPKYIWTDNPGDAFDPAGAGPYQFNDPEAPLEIWVNGVKQPRSLHIETNSVTFALNVVTPLQDGDRVFLRWIRTAGVPFQHNHLMYNRIVGSGAEQSFVLPFEIDDTTDREHVYINGVMQVRGEDYQITGDDNNIIEMDVPLAIGDLFQTETIRKEYRYRHVVSSDIVSAPYIQNGIDMPTIISEQGVNHEFRDGYLYCDYDFPEIWIPNLWVEEGTVEHNFGEPIDFIRDNSVAYTHSTRGLWYVYWNGPSVKNIEIGTKILMGVPYAPETTIVRSLLPGEGGTDIVLETSDGLVFTIEEPLQPIVNAGDTVLRFHPLADGVDVWDYINNPDWFKDIGMLYAFWSLFSVDGEPWVGYWDDGGFLDDGGFFDDGGVTDPTEREALNEFFFNLIKWFTFIVNVNSVLLNTQEAADSLIFFLETIKPAYTEYIALIDMPTVEDTARKATDVVEFELV